MFVLFLYYSLSCIHPNLPVWDYLWGRRAVKSSQRVAHRWCCGELRVPGNRGDHSRGPHHQRVVWWLVLCTDWRKKKKVNCYIDRGKQQQKIFFIEKSIILFRPIRLSCDVLLTNTTRWGYKYMLLHCTTPSCREIVIKVWSDSHFRCLYLIIWIRLYFHMGMTNTVSFYPIWWMTRKRFQRQNPGKVPLFPSVGKSMRWVLTGASHGFWPHFHGDNRDAL